MVFNVFKRGRKILKKVFTSSRPQKEPLHSIPVRKSQDELEWEKCKKFIMETPLTAIPEEYSFDATQRGLEVIEKIFEKEVGNCKTIEEFRKKMSKEYNVPMNKITISYKGRHLNEKDDYQYFSHYKIDSRSKIDVHIRAAELP